MPIDSNLSFYDRFAGPYQHLYAEIDEEAAVDRWVGVLQEFGLVQGPDARRLAPVPLVDVGCGAGKHLPAWKKRGFAPTGLDGSPTMLAYAESNLGSVNLECPLILADILTLGVVPKGASLFPVAASHL